MSVRKCILEASKNFHLDISNAKYGNFNYQGTNTLPVNRIYIILDSELTEKNSVINHSITPAQKLKLSSGHMYFIPKDQKLEFSFYPGINMIAFHFNIEIFPGIDLFDGDSLLQEMVTPKFLLDQILKIWNAKDNLGNTVILHGLIYSLIGLFSNKTLKHFTKQQDKMRQFEDLMNYIEEKGNAQTTVGELARFCDLEQDTLSKRFIRTAGVSLKTYLTRFLLRKASQELLATDLKVREVSEKLGFSSEYYFCRFFKKHTSMTPNSYRKFILAEDLG